MNQRRKKVGNSGDQRDNRRIGGRRRRELGTYDRRNDNNLETRVSAMFVKGFDTEEENSAILSALTRAVLAGYHEPTVADGGSDEPDGVSAASPVVTGVGEKRGRDDNDNESSLVAVRRTYNDYGLSLVDSNLRYGGERTNNEAIGGGANNNITDSSTTGGWPKRRNRGLWLGRFDTTEAAVRAHDDEAALKSRANNFPKNATLFPSLPSNSSPSSSSSHLFINSQSPFSTVHSFVEPIIHTQNPEFPTNSLNYPGVFSCDHLLSTSLLNQLLSSTSSQMGSSFHTSSTSAYPCPASGDYNENSTTQYPTHSLNYPNAAFNHLPVMNSNEYLARQHPVNSLNYPSASSDHLPCMSSDSNWARQQPTSLLDQLLFPNSFQTGSSFQNNSSSTTPHYLASSPAVPSAQMAYYDDDPVSPNTFRNTSDSGFSLNSWLESGYDPSWSG